MALTLTSLTLSEALDLLKRIPTPSIIEYEAFRQYFMAQFIWGYFLKVHFGLFKAQRTSAVGCKCCSISVEQSLKTEADVCFFSELGIYVIILKKYFRGVLTPKTPST